MLFMTRVTYPASETKRAIATFTSPDFPQRPDCAKELASFVYDDAHGNHTMFLVEVEDTRVPEFFARQTQRTVYFTTRVPGSQVDVKAGSESWTRFS